MLKKLLASNDVKEKTDYLFLARHVGTLHRCHTLDMYRRPTLAEHMLNCCYLLDYSYSNGLIYPVLTFDEYRMVRDYLLYHDVEETLIGDTPYTYPIAGDFDNVVRGEVVKHFGINVVLSPELHSLAKQIDMVDFLLTMLDDMDGNGQASTYKSRRKKKCIANAVDALLDLQSKATYKLEYQRFLQK